MRSCAITDKGIVRSQNQDAFYAACDDATKAAILLVCDGMGGARAGNVASELASQTFSRIVSEGLEEALPCGAICTLMSNALHHANRDVYELSRADMNCRGMGTTVVAAIVVGEDATVLNVGDSRCYLLSDGTITQVTRDHSVVEDMVRRGDITREESRHHPRKNLITRAVGTAPEVQADYFSVKLRDGDRLLLCSDGLSNIVADEELLEIVEGSSTLENACEALIAAALERGAPDNVTVVLFQNG